MDLRVRGSNKRYFVFMVILKTSGYHPLAITSYLKARTFCDVINDELYIHVHVVNNKISHEIQRHSEAISRSYFFPKYPFCVSYR